MAADNENNNRTFYRRVFALVTLGILGYLLFLVLQRYYLQGLLVGSVKG